MLIVSARTAASPITAAAIAETPSVAVAAFAV
jgi:hypothetical protein